MSEYIDKTLKKIEQGILDVMSSERYAEYLKFHSSFHNYSINNTMSIFMQNPDATMVKGYGAWQKNGRFVKKGETGIKILTPVTVKKDSDESISPRPNQEPQQEDTVKECKGFKVANVFDITQTDGRAVPAICEEIEGENDNVTHITNAIKNISSAKIIKKDIKGTAKGYFNSDDNVIAIRKDLHPNHQLKTLIHEYAHSIIHKRPYDMDLSDINRHEEEIQAESIACIVAGKYGLDTSQYSFDYLADWSKDKTTQDFKNSLKVISNMSEKIIRDIDDELEKMFHDQLDNYKETYPVSKSFDDEKMKKIADICSYYGKILSPELLKKQYLSQAKLEPDSRDKIFGELKAVADDIKDQRFDEMYKQDANNEIIEFGLER